jgi:hypothetical protein
MFKRDFKMIDRIINAKDVGGLSKCEDVIYVQGIICDYCTNWSKEINACRVARMDHSEVQSGKHDIDMQNVAINHCCSQFIFDVEKKHVDVMITNFCNNLSKFIRRFERIIELNNLKDYDPTKF